MAFRHPVTNKFVSADDFAILIPGQSAQQNFTDLMNSLPAGPARLFWTRKVLSFTSGEMVLFA